MSMPGRIVAIGLLLVGAAVFGLVGANAAGITHLRTSSALAGIVPATATPTAAATPQKNAGPPASVELMPLPDEIICDGQQASRLQVRVRDAVGSFVNEGTPVDFTGIGGGSVSASVATTSHGIAAVDVGAQNPASDPFRPFSIRVDVGRLEATIRVLCLPPGACPPSPPSSGGSPPQPTAVPCIPVTSPPQCNPFVSPPASPPCIVVCTPFPSPPQSVSPPCIPQSPPPCSPVSPPQSPFACRPACRPFEPASPPCATATPLPECSPFVPVSPPCIPPTATPSPCGGAPQSPPCGPPPGACADVTGDGTVSFMDTLAVSAQIRNGHNDPKYDLNRDGVVDVRDLRIVTSQLGRRC